MLGRDGKAVTSAQESTYPSTVLEQETVAVKPEGPPVYVGQGNREWVLGDFKELQSGEANGRSCRMASKELGMPEDLG